MKWVRWVLVFGLLLSSQVFGTGQKVADSLYICYSNIYNNVMANADSVRCIFRQGSKTDTFALSLIQTGFYGALKAVDSNGVVFARVRVYNWDGAGHDIDAAGELNDLLVIRGDSAYISYTNMFADSMLDVDSVIARTVQGSKTDTFALTKIATGVYRGRKRIDSLGLFKTFVDVYDWSPDTGKQNLYFGASKWVESTLVILTGGGCVIAPSSAAKCVVYGTVLNKNGSGRGGVKISITTTRLMRYNNAVVYQYPETTSTDATGFWSKELYKSDSLVAASNAAYRVIMRDTAEFSPILDQTFKVPDSNTWSFKYWR